MSTCAKVAEFLTVDELHERYRACTDSLVKTHWQIIWLRASGQTTKQTAEATGYKPDWVRQIIRRYNSEGPDGIRNRLSNNGRDPYLDEEQRAELFEVLSKRPDDGGLWSGPKVARWIEAHTGRANVTDKTGWSYLRSLGFTLQQPRPRHAEAMPDGEQWLKKRSVVTSKTSSAGIQKRK